MVNIYISEFHYILTRGFYVKSLLIDKNRQKCIFIGHKNANLLQNFPKLTLLKNKNKYSIENRSPLKHIAIEIFVYLLIY